MEVDQQDQDDDNDNMDDIDFAFQVAGAGDDDHIDAHENDNDNDNEEEENNDNDNDDAEEEDDDEEEEKNKEEKEKEEEEEEEEEEEKDEYADTTQGNPIWYGLLTSLFFAEPDSKEELQALRAYRDYETKYAGHVQPRPFVPSKRELQQLREKDEPAAHTNQLDDDVIAKKAIVKAGKKNKKQKLQQRRRPTIYSMFPYHIHMYAAQEQPNALQAVLHQFKMQCVQVNGREQLARIAYESIGPELKKSGWYLADGPDFQALRDVEAAAVPSTTTTTLTTTTTTSTTTTTTTAAAPASASASAITAFRPPSAFSALFHLSSELEQLTETQLNALVPPTPDDVAEFTSYLSSNCNFSACVQLDKEMIATDNPFNVAYMRPSK